MNALNGATILHVGRGPLKRTDKVMMTVARGLDVVLYP